MRFVPVGNIFQSNRAVYLYYKLCIQGDSGNTNNFWYVFFRNGGGGGFIVEHSILL